MEKREIISEEFLKHLFPRATSQVGMLSATRVCMHIWRLPRGSNTPGSGAIGFPGVTVRRCRTLGGKDWNLVLPNIHEQIIFLDEENQFVKSQEFASAVKASDNYFVIITREDLPNLPYSVDEIYGFHTSGKYHDLKRTCNELYRIYGAKTK